MVGSICPSLVEIGPREVGEMAATDKQTNKQAGRRQWPDPIEFWQQLHHLSPYNGF
jgi:hypothetical protein